jgi:hypothetical protein
VKAARSIRAVTGSKEPENEGQNILDRDMLDRPVRCPQYRRLQWGGRRAAGKFDVPALFSRNNAKAVVPE